MSVINSFIQNIRSVFIANSINLFANGVSGLLLPALLSVNSYADIAQYQLYILYVGVLHLGYSDGMYLKYGGSRITKLDKSYVMSEYRTFFIFQLILTIIALLAALLWADIVMILCVLSILPINVFNYIRNLYQSTGEFKRYSRMTNQLSLLTLAANLLLLLVMKVQNPLPYIVAYLSVYVFILFFVEFELHRIFTSSIVKPSSVYMKKNIREGFALMMSNFIAVLYFTVARTFAQIFTTKLQFAQLAFATNLESLINFFMGPLNVTFYNLFCKIKTKTKIISIKRVVMVFISYALVGFFVLKIVIQSYLPHYVESIPVLAVLFVSLFLTSIIRVVYVNLMKVERMQSQYLYSVVGSTLFAISIFAIMLYLDIVNILNIAYTMLIANVIWFMVCEVLLRKYSFLVKDYLYISTIIILILFLQMLDITFIAIMIYIVIVTAMSKVLYNKDLRYFFDKMRYIFLKPKKTKENV